MPVNIQYEVKKEIETIGRKVQTKSFQASNILKKHELQILGRKGGVRSGRRYSRTGFKTKYTASAPGEPPARRSSNLRGSWRTMRGTSSIGTGGAFSATAGIETNCHYAGYLEDGTSKMAARPHHDKIIESATPEIKTLFSDI